MRESHNNPGHSTHHYPTPRILDRTPNNPFRVLGLRLQGLRAPQLTTVWAYWGQHRAGESGAPGQSPVPRWPKTTQCDWTSCVGSPLLDQMWPRSKTRGSSLLKRTKSIWYITFSKLILSIEDGRQVFPVLITVTNLKMADMSDQNSTDWHVFTSIIKVLRLKYSMIL